MVTTLVTFSLSLIMPSLRRYDEPDEPESEELSLRRQILPVADLPDDFDDEPADGMQYLFTVR